MLGANYEIYSEGGLGHIIAHIYIHEESGSNLSEYQVGVDLNESNFGYWQAEPRIKIYQGGTQCSYWAEFWNSSNKQAKIWIKVPSIPANSTVHLVIITSYYSTSNGEATFEFFDDFEGTSLKSGWNDYGTPNYSVHDGYLDMGMQDGGEGIYFAVSYPNDVSIDWRGKKIGGSDNAFSIFMGIEPPSSGADSYMFHHYGWANSKVGIYRDFWAEVQLALVEIGGAPTEWADFSSQRHGSSLRILQNGSQLASATDNTYTSGFGYIGLHTWSDSKWAIDYVRIRKYTSPEPTVTVVPV